MNKTRLNHAAAFIIMILTGTIVSGCAQKAETPSAAIETSKTYKTIPEQADYINNQANDFLKSQEYNQALELAQYVLVNLDKNSSQAHAIVEKAKTELQKAAGQMVNEAKDTMNSLGSQLNSFTQNAQSK